MQKKISSFNRDDKPKKKKKDLKKQPSHVLSYFSPDQYYTK